MSDPEKKYIIEAFSFELGKCKEISIRKQVVDMFANADLKMSQQIAKNIGVEAPMSGASIPEKNSPALSQENTIKTPMTRKVGILLAPDFNGEDLKQVLDSFKGKGVKHEIISEMQGILRGSDGTEMKVGETFSTTDPVLYDAIYAIGGPVINKKFAKEGARYIAEAFDHYKPIGATHEGMKWLHNAEMRKHPGVVAADDMEEFTDKFLDAIREHRHWKRNVG